MDPNACLKRLKATLAETEDARADLHAWLASGGFEPEWESAIERVSVLALLERDLTLKLPEWDDDEPADPTHPSFADHPADSEADEETGVWARRTLSGWEIPLHLVEACRQADSKLDE